MSHMNTQSNPPTPKLMHNPESRGLIQKSTTIELNPNAIVPQKASSESQLTEKVEETKESPPVKREVRFQDNIKDNKNNEESDDGDDDNDCCCSLFHPPSLKNLKSRGDVNQSACATLSGKDYLFYGAMDEPNKAAVDIMMTEGMNGAITHMMTRPNGTPRSYAEMRDLYG